MGRNKRSWFGSAKEMVGSWWTVAGVVVSTLSMLAGIYQQFLVPLGLPAFQGGNWVEPWIFWVFGFGVLVVTGISAYHKLACHVDELTDQLDKDWRTERRTFEAEYGQYRDEVSEFLTTCQRRFGIAQKRRRKLHTF